MIQYLSSAVSSFGSYIGKISWKANKEIPNYSKEKIKELIKSDYYIIVTRRSNHLSTYIINLLEVYLRFKLGYWSHALMNLEDNVTSDKDFRLLEATGKGVGFVDFDTVFDVQAVALLKPRSMTVDEWTTVLDTAKVQQGKAYDSLFDITDDKKLSCIELIRVVLKASPGYDEDFANFEKMIKKCKNVSPQMLYDCEDFEIQYEIVL